MATGASDGQELMIDITISPQWIELWKQGQKYNDIFITTSIKITTKWFVKNNKIAYLVESVSTKQQFVYFTQVKIGVEENMSKSH